MLRKSFAFFMAGLLLCVVAETSFSDLVSGGETVSIEQTITNSLPYPCDGHHDSDEHDLGGHCHAGHCCFLLFSNTISDHKFIEVSDFRYILFVPEGFSSQIYHPPIA